jgi:AcrR family transcriptional regulator
MNRSKPELKPRKLPIQVRSKHTIDIIFEATIQVLLVLGVGKLTTTKVADRAGVSVGTLYQYFPKKQALLGALLERHLFAVVEEVEKASAQVQGSKLDLVAKELVDAYLNIKLKLPEVSVALYSVALALEASSIVSAMTKRTQIAVGSALAAVPDRKFDQLDITTIILTTSLMGPVQAFLVSNPPKAAFGILRCHLKDLALGYLKNASVKR